MANIQGVISILFVQGEGEGEGERERDERDYCLSVWL